MVQIRNNVFETNSSSTHSLCIPKKAPAPTYISFHIGEYGWGFREENPADYFYTAIYYISDNQTEVDEKLEKLKNILDAHNIEYYFEPVATHLYHSDYDNKDHLSLDYGYIDHGYELESFVDEMLNDGDKLVRFLSNGLVFTGNDNEDNAFVNRDQEFIEDYNWRTNQLFKTKNPYYMSNHGDYEWYWKGN